MKTVVTLYSGPGLWLCYESHITHVGTQLSFLSSDSKPWWKLVEQMTDMRKRGNNLLQQAGALLKSRCVVLFKSGSRWTGC